MIELCAEVGNVAASRRVLVQADCIRRALNVIEKCYPCSAAGVVFPINPETFFVGKAGAAQNLTKPKAPGATAVGFDMGERSGQIHA